MKNKIIFDYYSLDIASFPGNMLTFHFFSLKSLPSFLPSPLTPFLFSFATVFFLLLSFLFPIPITY